MVNIFNIPLYYIGFKRNQDLEKQLSKVGFKNVNHFPAIDGRKMNPQKLLKNNTIGVRAYNDLVYGQQERNGISSLGTIGCTLSHRELWKLCAQKYPYIIIAEDDLDIKKISNKDIKNIERVLEKKNGCFVSSKYIKNNELLSGLHLYFLTNGAASKLYEKSLPIHLQTDGYVANLGNIEDITLEGYSIAKQKVHRSSTGNLTCIKCNLPRGIWFYLIILIGIILLIIFGIFIYKKYIRTKFQLDSCRSSCESSYRRDV